MLISDEEKNKKKRMCNCLFGLVNIICQNGPTEHLRNCVILDWQNANVAQKKMNHLFITLPRKKKWINIGRSQGIVYCVYPLSAAAAGGGPSKMAYVYNGIRVK